MKKTLRTSLTTKSQTTVPKPVREALGVGPHDPVYWEIRDGEVRLSAGEPRFYRWFGAIEVGPGSVVEDVAAARRMRGTR